MIETIYQIGIRATELHLAGVYLQRVAYPATKYRVRIIHVNFNFTFDLGCKVGMRIIHVCVLYVRFYGKQLLVVHC